MLIKMLIIFKLSTVKTRKKVFNSTILFFNSKMLKTQTELMLDVMSLTVAANLGSSLMSSSTFRIEESTVEWFLSSYSAPISLSGRLVSVRMRYMDIWRAVAVFLLRFWPRRSSSFKEK